MKHIPIVAMQSFVEATRESGYKSTGSAIAEFIDNALEAGARHVDLEISETIHYGEGPQITVTIIDDGKGMEPCVLRSALQFGGSTRFGSRVGLGRYGMGLPNGALSQARRLDVFTWIESGRMFTSHLDVDEIASGQMRGVPEPRLSQGIITPRTKTGTVIVLSKCDRLDFSSVLLLSQTLAVELGCIFRRFLLAGKRIRINNVPVHPFDPLYLARGTNLRGAEPYGAPLQYVIRVPKGAKTLETKSVVTVRFSELPLEVWHNLSNDRKNEFRITKHAGVSIVRANREIDYGWYFMGTKRKENYDDWWRCEISFSPELDEMFGVTHSKQKINPTELLSAILTPEIERVARELNSRIRKKYSVLKSQSAHFTLLRRFESRDHLLEPPQIFRRATKKNQFESAILRKRNDGIQGMRFAISHQPQEHSLFFSTDSKAGMLRLNINKCHPFYSVAYRTLVSANPKGDENGALQCVLLLLISCARAECTLNRSKHREIMKQFHQLWSDTVAAFLS